MAERTIPKVRNYLFWDVDRDTINWHTESAAAWLLERIVERGGHQGDFNALVTFYGFPTLQEIGRKLKYLRFTQSRSILARLLSLDPSEMRCYADRPPRAKRLLSY